MEPESDIEIQIRIEGEEKFREEIKKKEQRTTSNDGAWRWIWTLFF